MTGMATSTGLHVLLAGGGSGGHVFPALAVGEELASRGCAVSFAGSGSGMEARLVPARGVPFHPLRSRALVGRGLAGKVAALVTLGLSSLGGARLVRRLGVGVVLGTGGYASAPAVLGARMARRPVLLLEPNARAGVANRQLSRFAAGAAVAFPEVSSDFACPTRATGVPVRRAFFDGAGPLPRQGLRLLLLGGSQGARSLNRALPLVLGGAEGLLARLPELTVVHQTGGTQLEPTRDAYRLAQIEVTTEVRAEVTADVALTDNGPGGGDGDRSPATASPEAAAQPPRVRLAPFIEDVAGEMARSHLVVSRAGAITVAEVAAAGRPSVLVPISLAEGHQQDNARALEAAGAARAVFEPRAATGDEGRAEADRALAEVLKDTLALLLADRAELEQMAEAARGLGRPDAAKAIADWLLELAGAPATPAADGSLQADSAGGGAA